MNERNQPEIKERQKPGPKPKAKNTIERGRTGTDLPPAMQASDQGLCAGSREEVAHSSKRPPRISMGNMKKLEIPDGMLEDGFYYRWFQDREGRISMAKAAYYEHVVDEQGNNFTRQSGKYTMHLMRLPQEYRDEDNALKRKRVAATLEEEAHIGANEYAPDEKGRAEGGTSAVSHQISDDHRA
jgi:hypothetical protein